MDILQTRRQRLLDASHYSERYEDLNLGISETKQDIDQLHLIPEALSDFVGSIATDKLQLLILRYTAGEPVRDLAPNLSDLIDAVEASHLKEFELAKPAAELYTYDLNYIEGYVEILWLLSLSVLLGHREQAPRIIGWIDQIEAQGDPNRGRDGLFEFIAEALTGEHVEPGRVLLHADEYRSLARAIVADPEERPAYVAEFLKGWYKAMKPCYWHGFHKDTPRLFFGYWAFEAALVTYLWDIDDSSYRDHEFYPKDLVDYARSLKTTEAPTPTATAAGEPCPRSGWWFTPAQSGSRQYFKQGEAFPNVERTDYGKTFWQWDINQNNE